MKKSDELKQEIAAKRAEVEAFRQENKLKEAKNASDELSKLVDECEVALAMEKSNFENFFKGAEQVDKPSGESIATLRNRAFNKLVLGRERYLTEDERKAYFNVSGSPGQPGQIESIDDKGGYLVPEEQMRTLQEFRKAYVALKDYVTVINTNSVAGRWPILPFQQLAFQDFAEMTDIQEGDITFSEATYSIADRGLIVPVSKQLVADADVDIISIIGRMLAAGAVKAENLAILSELNKLVTETTESGGTTTTTLKVTPITSYKALNKALFKELDSVYYPQAKIITNQDGLLYLADLDDGNNRPLFTPDVTVPDTYRYRGKEIVVVPNLTLPSVEVSSKSYAPFFVGDMKAYITFFERQGMELAISDELYFRKYGKAIRAVVRWGVTVTDADAMVALAVEL